jgi:5-methylthioadenosine/S-adenosylhomocysteine deaminase
MSSDRILLRGGYVLSLDESVGELPVGDVLIDSGAIAEVAERVDIEDVEIVDVSGHVVMPGFIDTHRHTWQTCLRGICADWTLGDYARGIRIRICPSLTAEDVYAGNYVGALEALDAGVTTILDFSHCNNSPEHADGALQGLHDAGIRAVFGYGYYPAYGADTAFASHADRLADSHRIRNALSSDTGLVTMGIALTECALVPFDDTIAEVATARELAVPTVMHTGCNWGSPITEGIPELDHHGLLGPEQVHVHCNTLSDTDFDRLRDHECKLSSSPETELQMGMGHPVIGRALERGMRPSLSADVMSSNSGDMFTQMRLGLQFERVMRNDVANAEGRLPDTLEPTTRDAIGWATGNGAHAMGMEERIGSLAPGSRADVIVIGGRRLNMVPMTDPVGCVVAQANSSNVVHVLVDGRFVKRDSELVGIDLDDAIKLADRSSERIVSTVRADGQPLLPELPEGFNEMLNAQATANLARAWEIEPSGA